MTQDEDFKTLFNDLLSYRLTTTYFGVQNNQEQIKFPLPEEVSRRRINFKFTNFGVNSENYIS